MSQIADVVAWWAERDGHSVERVSNPAWRDDVDGISIDGKTLTLTGLQKERGIDYAHQLYTNFVNS